MAPHEITKAIISSQHDAMIEVKDILAQHMPQLADCYWGEQPEPAPGQGLREAVVAGDDYRALARRLVRDRARSWCDELAAEHDGDAATQAKIADAKAAI